MDTSRVESNAPSAITYGRPITVMVPPEVAFDIDKTQAILKSVLGKLGCQGCTSGFDIRFVLERDFVVNPATLEVINARQF
jgi:hypothetical protein